MLKIHIISLLTDSVVSQTSGSQKSWSEKGGHKRPGHKRPGHKRPGHKRPGHKRPATVKTIDKYYNKYIECYFVVKTYRILNPGKFISDPEPCFMQ